MAARKIDKEEIQKSANKKAQTKVNSLKKVESNLPAIVDRSELTDRKSTIKTRNCDIRIQARNYKYIDNHSKILHALKTSIITLSRMPSAIELADFTGLSRQTVTKHLNEITTYYYKDEHIGKLQAMREQTLVKLFEMGFDEWTKDSARIQAMKLFLCFTSHLSKTNKKDMEVFPILIGCNKP